MATNKKITQLDELTPATWADDDVIAIVDISAQETKKIQLSTFRGAVTGVSSLNASTPLTVDSATGDVTIGVAINGGGTINAVFDEDDMTSNSPTALATQQSIKAYVDSQVGTVDTLAEILSNGNTSGGTNIVVSAGDSITTDTIAETTAAAGVTIDSVLVKDGEVDGRDVSVDGTKLDTIETNADVTDTANVTAAGALMDSELTNITAVKALDQGVATTDTPTFAGLITAGNVDGRDVSADGAKLDGIEAGADVTDTANVTAAGALMDSELTNIAAVKALNQGVATTDTPTFAGLTATTADINGGTIDGAVIGGASAAAGTFTTLVANTSLGVGGSPGVGGDLEVIGATSATLETRTSSGGRRIALLASDSSGALIGTRSNHALAIMTNNTQVADFGTGGDLSMVNAAGPSLLNEAATSTNPTQVPNRADPDTGIGWVSADVGALVAGGAEALRWDSSGNVTTTGDVSADNLVTTVARNSTVNLDSMHDLDHLGSVQWVDGGGTISGTLPSSVSYSGSDTGIYATLDPLEGAAGNQYQIQLHHDMNDGNGLVYRSRAGGTWGGWHQIVETNTAGNILAGNAAGPALMNEAASGSNPTVLHNKAAPTYGLGGTSTTTELIAAGASRLLVNNSGNVGIGSGVDIQSHFAIGFGAEQFEVNVGSGFARIQIYDRTAGAYDNFQVDALTHAFRIGQTEAMRIDSSGNVTTTGDMFIDRDGGTSAAWLNIDATNGYQTGVRLLTAGVKRWEIGTHEASALEDFVLRSYNDAGGGVVEAMYITRSNSQVAFVGNVVGTNATGPALMNEAASATNPTVVPNRANPTSGFGANGAGNTIYGVGGGTEHFRFGNGAMDIGVALDVDQIQISGNIGFYGTAAQAKPTITGSRAGNAALADLLTKLATLGLITDSTS